MAEVKRPERPGAFKMEADKAWLPVLKEQEEKLRYETFTREQAMELGLKIVELVKEREWGHAAVHIVEDGMTIFAYKMPGTNLQNDWWMDRKLALSVRAGCSSLLAFARGDLGEGPNLWEDRPDNYATCGGCIPVFMKDGTVPWAYVMVSGMMHTRDHQSIADAMAWQLGVDIPSVCE